MKNNTNKECIEWIESLTKDDLLSIIKYGLRGYPGAPIDVTVDDIYDAIGCNYINGIM